MIALLQISTGCDSEAFRSSSNTILTDFQWNKYSDDCSGKWYWQRWSWAI